MKTFVFYWEAIWAHGLAEQDSRTIVVAAQSQERAAVVSGGRGWDWCSEIACKSEEEGILFDSRNVSVY